MKFPTKIPNRKSNKCKAANHGPKSLANHSSSCSSSSNLNESLDILRLEPLLGDSKTPHHHQRAAAGHSLQHCTTTALHIIYIYIYKYLVWYPFPMIHGHGGSTAAAHQRAHSSMCCVLRWSSGSAAGTGSRLPGSVSLRVPRRHQHPDGAAAAAPQHRLGADHHRQGPLRAGRVHTGG